MSDFRQLSEKVWASPQITLADVAEAGARGITLIINNRPEGESPDQTPGDAIAAAAAGQGIEYRAIPVSPGGFTLEQAEAMADALAAAGGPVLAYCRSGTRSTLLWALAQAKCGAQPADLMAAAEHAGYDLSPIAGALQRLAAGAQD
jgi:uncharacterized protein (TIGR01244 family)